jgi:hypothetical protein
MEYLLGFGDSRLHWPPGGVIVSVSNYGRAAPSDQGGPLRVSRADFGPFEGVRTNFAQTSISSHGRLVGAYVRVGKLTPATIAAANQILAGVRTCSS